MRGAVWSSAASPGVSTTSGEPIAVEILWSTGSNRDQACLRLATMRPHRLLTPLTVILALGSAAPAMAADLPVEVVDYEFLPAERKIALGDTVIWSFTNGGHTPTAGRGQGPKRESGAAPQKGG